MTSLGLIFLLASLFTSTEGARDGGWSEWNDWSPCAATCGLASQYRVRLCNNPPPSPGGKFCAGNPREKKRCDALMQCPVDGGWSNWSFWTDCSRTCGRGVRRRQRTCNEPLPQGGGKPCDGVPEQRQTCTVQINCPRNGQWSAWSGWSACTVTCGEGRRERFRFCNNPPPSDGGKPCGGFGSEINDCRGPAECPINGQWSGWSDWSPCPVTCGTAEIRRFRSCDNPPPLFGGSNCTGNPTEVELCGTGIPCPVNGQWSQWSVWGPCFSTNCRTKKESLSYRQRSCNNPLPAHDGLMCQGVFVIAGTCRNPVNCPVDGRWSDWSDWECSAAVAKRTRSCDNPPPTNGGKPCPDQPAVEFYRRDEEEDLYREVCGNPPDDDDEDAQIGGSGQGLPDGEIRPRG